jgi:SAM-dependent methyltransferase
MSFNPFNTQTASSAVDYWRCDKLISTLKTKKQFGNSLDIGDKNPFTKRLVDELNITKLKNTQFDLNYPQSIDDKFDSIFCFEVLEHVQNPLLLLDWIAEHLEQEGTLYLTTPKGGFPSVLMWPPSHYHEIDLYRIKVLFDLSKLKIKENRIFKAPPTIYLRTGLIRPLFRILWGGWIYIEAKKKVVESK